MVLWSILTSVALYYTTLGHTVSYLMARDQLADKPTEKILSMKNFRDASKVKKALYVLVPGVYFAVKSEKQRRAELEGEFMKKYKVEPISQ